MKFAILGYGKMGKQVEELLKKDQQEIVAIIDNEDDWQNKIEDFKKADVAIDFSMPTVAIANIMKAFQNHVPIVVGTTGWLEQLGYVQETCKELNGSMVYGSNFSIGANLFMEINRRLSVLMNKQSQYSPAMEETHHVTKKDAPSGTAIRLAKDILANVDRLDHWELTEQSDDTSKLPIKANRIGNEPGTHTIVWHSEEDDIEITHQAHNRQGFARGAIQAAVWLTAHSGFFEFQDIVLQL